MKPFRMFALIAITLSLALPARTATTFVPKILKHEFYSGKVRASLEGTAAVTPTYTEFLPSFETGVNIADNYANRVSGYFVPAVTGDYVFFDCSDDDSDLFLSTDDTSANKRLIAQETAWSNNRQWVSSGGSSTLSQKRSDQWSPDGGTTTPFANGIHLIAGNHYYIEGVHHEGGGGDDFTATMKLISDPDPNDGDPTTLTGNLIGVSVPLPTSLTITTQPANVTASAGLRTQFNVAVQTDSVIPPAFQWRRAGTNIAGATGSAYSLVTSLPDNGALFDVVVTIPGLTNTVTSSAAKLTVQTNGVNLVTGSLKREFFPGASRAGLESGNVGQPATITSLKSFDAPVNVADNYAQRVSGYFIPATTGDYVFFLSSDDDSDLFLSTDSTVANKRLIAQETSWSNDRQWVTSGGGSDLAKKRSDQFLPAGSTTAPFAAGIHLIAGNRYYIEGDHHEGGGGDDLGATFKLISEADPSEGDASRLTNGLIAYPTSPVTKLVVGTQPQNVNVFEGLPYSFSVGLQTDAEFTPIYQWQKNGTNIPGANASTYKVTTALVPDSGSKYSVVVTLPDATNTVTSSQATLTVQQSVFVTGYSKRELWQGGITSRGGVEAGTNPDPTSTSYFTSVEGPINFDNSYVQRFSGFFVPPVTGDYIFFISSDDNSDLFLSTDNNPVNKREIAQETAWSNTRQWVTSGGSSNLAQKRSDQWSPDGGTTVPYASGIHLIAGSHYYYEAIHEEGGGGDNVAVTYNLLADPDPADGDAPKMTGNAIGVLLPAATVTFTQQPQNISVVQNTAGTFSVGATSSSVLTPTIQWQKASPGGSFSNITGAVSSSYTTGLMPLTASGTRYRAVISTVGTNVNSQEAVLTVTADTTPPTIATALRNFTNKNNILITFSEPIDASAATAANFQINGAAVAGAALGADGKSVVITSSVVIANGSTNSVTVSGVKDLFGNTITANSPATVGFQKGVLFVGAETVPTTFPGDIAVVQHMIDRGFDVQTIMGSDVPDNGSSAIGKDLVLQSSSLGSGTVENTVGGIQVSKFRDIAVPVVEWEPSNEDGYSFQAANGGSATESRINIVDATSPLAAGFPTGLVTVVTSPQTIVEGTPTGGHIVATFATDSSQAVIYNYDKGEKGYNNFVMPARRVFFFFQDNTAAFATPAAWKLFDASVDWALGTQGSVVVGQPQISVSRSGSSITISWTNGGTLQSTTSLASPITWKTESTTSPFTTTAAGSSKFYRVTQ